MLAWHDLGRVQLRLECQSTANARCCRARQVATALKDRAQRIYEKYGNVMLDVAGMTKAGIERKATCRALFSKILYLAGAPDLDPLPIDGNFRQAQPMHRDAQACSSCPERSMECSYLLM